MLHTFDIEAQIIGIKLRFQSFMNELNITLTLHPAEIMKLFLALYPLVSKLCNIYVFLSIVGRWSVSAIFFQTN